MESALNWSMVVSIIGVLVVLTNIVVQVLKKLTWDRLPTNVLAVVVSMILYTGDILRLLSDQCHRRGVVYGSRRSRYGLYGFVCSHVRL